MADENSPSLQQFLSDQLGRGRRTLTVSLHESSGGDLRAVISPQGAEGEAMTFKVEDNSCLPG